MEDLFDSLGASPGTGEPDPQVDDEAEAAATGANQVLADVPAGTENVEVITEGSESVEEDEAEEDSGEEPAESEAKPASPGTGEKKPKPVNVVEQDPYDFDKCLITVALGLMPDDGSPEGRLVMLGARNHQDEPILTTCRLSDLMPLPDPVQRLLDQLKEQLPARSEKAAERKKKAEASKKARPVVAGKKAKAGKAQASTLNLFDMFDQPAGQEATDE